MRKMCSARSAIQKPRRLHDIFRRNIRDTQKSSQFLGKSEHKHFIGKLAAANVATDAIDLLELQGSLYGGLVFEQKPEHEIERSEVDGEDDFAARNSDNGIKLRMCAKPFPFHMSEKIRIGAFLLYGRRNDIRPLLFARLELYGAWKVNLGSRIISLGKMPINRAERHIELWVRSDDNKCAAPSQCKRK